MEHIQHKQCQNTRNTQVGIPAPNPTFPQEIKNVEGKNLVILETSSAKIIGGVPFTIENGIININGTTSSGSSNFYFDSFQVKKSGTATFGIDIVGYTDKTSGNASVMLEQSDDNSNWSVLQEIGCKSTFIHQYQVLLDSSKYYRIRLYTNENIFTKAIIKIELEYGIAKTEYVPYDSIGIKVQNKNYLDIENIDYGYINSSGAFVASNNNVITRNYIPVQTNETIVISANTSMSIMSVVNYDENYNFINRNSYSNKTSQLVTITNQDIKHIKVVFDKGSTDMHDIVSTLDLMIEKGETKTAYQTHAEQISYFTFEEGQYLAKGGYLADDGIHNVWKKVVFDGSSDENWRLNSYNYFEIYIDNIVVGTNTGIHAICTDFKGINYIDRITYTSPCLTLKNNDKFLEFRNSGLENNLEAWRAWLSNNPIIVQYELAEESITPYTEAQQAQWNAIKKMKTYKNVSHISTEGGTLEPSNDVVYYKDLETLFNNLSA